MAWPRYFSASAAIVLLALAAACTQTAQSASPGTVVVAGPDSGRVLDAQTLQNFGQFLIAGPWVAVANDPVHNVLHLLDGAPDPGWIRLAWGNHQLDRRHLPFIPQALALSADGATAYIAGVSGGAERIAAANVASGALQPQVPAGGAAIVGLAVTPSPAPRLAAASADGRLFLYTLPSLQALASIPLPNAPRQVLSLPWGHSVFVLCQDRIAVVDTESGKLVTNLIPGVHPQRMVLKPDGGELYVSNADGTVTVIDTSRDEVSTTMAAGVGAGAMAVTPDGSTLYVANAAAGTVDVIDLDNRQVLAVVHVGEQPSSLALGANGTLFVADTASNDIAVIRGHLDPDAPNALIALLPSPPHPNLVAGQQFLVGK